MISIDHGKFTAQFSTVAEVKAYIEKEQLDINLCIFRMRVRIPGSDFEPLVEAIEASGGAIL